MCWYEYSLTYNLISVLIFLISYILLANTLKNKGNVLFPCSMDGIILDFLSQHLKVMGLRIPLYAVSPIAEESLKYSNICGEWYVKLIILKIII